MVDVESAGPRDRDGVEQHVRDGCFRHRPKDPAAFGPAGGGGRNVLKQDVFPVRSGC